LKPGEGPGTSFHLGLLTLISKSKAQFNFIPYPGSAPAATAVMGSHVTAAIVGYSVVSGTLKAGNLRALAVAAERRMAPLPDVPTFAEGGFPTIRMDNWFGAIAPAKTSADNKSTDRVVQDSDGCSGGSAETGDSGPLFRAELRLGFFRPGPQALRRVWRSHQAGWIEERLGHQEIPT
jgi:hypothetical protein